MLFNLPPLSDPGVWVSLVTLCFLEIILGVDNVLFISIISAKLPEQQQKKARNVGLTLAMFFRVGLLLCINWIISMKASVFTLGSGEHVLDLSVRDLILIAGGLFLIVKSTLEIHHKLQLPGGETKRRASTKFGAIIFQIVLVDAVFSFDSILTAVGLVDYVSIMIVAVVVSILVIMAFAGWVIRIINNQPTLQMLALTFLIVIGVVLVAEGLHQEISKSIIYSCLGFSLVVEMLNIKLRKNQSIPLNNKER